MGCRLRCSSVNAAAGHRDDHGDCVVPGDNPRTPRPGGEATRSPRPPTHLPNPLHSGRPLADPRIRHSCLAHRFTDHRQQDQAAAVQRGRRDLPAARDQFDARVDVGHVPPAVPARVLHPRAEHPAPALLDLQGHPREQVGVERGGGAAHPDPAAGLELCQVHIGPRLGHRARCRTVRTAKATAGCRAVAFRICCVREPGTASGAAPPASGAVRAHAVILASLASGRSYPPRSPPGPARLPIPLHCASFPRRSVAGSLAPQSSRRRALWLAQCFSLASGRFCAPPSLVARSQAPSLLSPVGAAPFGSLSYRGGSGGRRLEGRSAVVGALAAGVAGSASRAIRTAVSSCGSRPAA